MADGFVDERTDPHVTLDPDQRQQLHGELTGDDLVAAVYADPDADEPRLVYGDYLLERDDPRGELIQLQLARHGDGTAPTPRETELLAAHLQAWCAPLFPALYADSIEFERGFLARCRVFDHSIAVRDVTGHPAWLTVVELTSEELPLVTHSCLRSVRRLETSIRCLAALAGATTAPPLVAARVRGGGRFRERARRRDWDDQGVLELWQRVLDVGALRSLRALALETTLEIETPDTLALLASPLGRQLTSLEFAAASCTLTDWVRALGDHPTLRRVAVRGFETGRSRVLRYELGDPDDALAVLERDDDGAIRAVVELGTSLPTEGTMRTIASLPEAFRAVELRSLTGAPIPDDVARSTTSWLQRRFAEVVVREVTAATR